MANLEKVIRINETDYGTLVGGDTITKDGVEYEYDDSALYVIENPSPPAYALTAGQANTAVKDVLGRNIVDTYTTKEKTFIDMSVSGTTPSFKDANNNSLTHAQVIALLADYTKDVEIRHGFRVFICTYNGSDGEYYFSYVDAGDRVAGSFMLQVNNNSLIFTSYNDVYLVTSAEKTTWNGKYDKPSGGIPKTDLASAVQTSLGKADTSVQKITSTDNAIARYDGTGGQIQNSGVTINDSNQVTAAKFITSGGTSSQFVKGDGSLDSTAYAPKASPALTGTPTAPTAASGTNTTQVATTAFVQNALSNMGAGGSEMVDVTITGTTSAASFSANPYNAIKAVVDDGKIAVLNANVAPISTTGVLIPVYEYTYSQSGSYYTGYKGSIQHGSYEISVDVQSTSSATVTITEVSASVTVDTALSETSTNPVQNRVITAQILENEEIVATALNNLNDRVELKQDQLVSGTTIKTINNQSILGSGNITISGGSGGGGGEENVIESITFNGTAVPVDANKNAAITADVDYVVEFSYDETEEEYVCSKTYSEITAALAANRKVVGVAKYNNTIQGIYSNVYTTGNSVYFVQLDEGEGSSPEIFSFILSNADELTTSTHRLLQDTDSVICGANNIWCSITIGSNDAVTVSNNPFTDFDSYIFGNEQSVILKASVTYNSASYNHDVLIHAKYTGTGAANRKYIGVTPLEYTNNKYLYLEFTNTTASGKVVEFYSKPSTGIPSTDLASAVQTSLGLADTALQSYTETDPVFTASAAAGITSANISTWNGKYSKPSGGIPKTDLATAVQTSLGKADTALQPDENNDLGQGTLYASSSQGFNYLIADKDTSSEQTLQDALDAKASTSAVNAKYTKPAAGIPDTDLTTAVNMRLLAQLSSSSDDGKIMKYSYSGGGWQAVKPVTIYSGSSAPSSSVGSDGDIYIQTS